MSDREKLKEEIAFLSDFERRMILNLIAEGWTLRNALRIRRRYLEIPEMPEMGPSEIKE